MQFAIATADGTATSGSDYTAKSVTGLSIPVGGATHSFTVQVFGDTTPEMDETLTVKLSDVVGATVGSAGTGTIKNDDTRSLTVGDASVPEGRSGAATLTFPITLSHPAPAGGVTFSAATGNGSATAGADYTARTLSNHTLAEGSTSFSFTVDVTGDALLEPDETVTVTLSGVTGATIARAEATGTIVNDDTATVGGKNLTITTEPLRLTWDSGEGQTGYYVIKADVTRGTSKEHGPLPASATTWLDELASPEVLGCYTVVAINKDGVIGSSDMLCAQIGVQNGSPLPGEFTLGLNQSATATLTWTGSEAAFSEVLLGVVPMAASGQTVLHRLAGTTRSHTISLSALTCYVVAGVNGAAVGITNVLCGNPGVHSLAANGPTGWAELASGRLARPGRTSVPSAVRATAGKAVQRLGAVKTRPAVLMERARQVIARATGVKNPTPPTRSPNAPVTRPNTPAQQAPTTAAPSPGNSAADQRPTEPARQPNVPTGPAANSAGGTAPTGQQAVDQRGARAN